MQAGQDQAQPRSPNNSHMRFESDGIDLNMILAGTIVAWLFVAWGLFGIGYGILKLYQRVDHWIDQHGWDL